MSPIAVSHPSHKDVAILGFDLKGSSKLDHTKLLVILTKIWQKLHDIVHDPHYKYNFIPLDGSSKIQDENTWGDGFVVISESVIRIGQIALELRDYFFNRKYSLLFQELKDDKLDCRICITRGKTAFYPNPFRNNKESYFGWNFIKCDEINAQIPPNSVWVTESYKNALLINIETQNKFKVKPFHLNPDLPRNVKTIEGSEDVFELYANKRERDCAIKTTSQAKPTLRSQNIEATKKYLDQIEAKEEVDIEWFNEFTDSVKEINKQIKILRDMEIVLAEVGNIYRIIHELFLFIRSGSTNTKDLHDLLDSAKDILISFEEVMMKHTLIEGEPPLKKHDDATNLGKIGNLGFYQFIEDSIGFRDKKFNTKFGTLTDILLKKVPDTINLNPTKKKEYFKRLEDDLQSYRSSKIFWDNLDGSFQRIYQDMEQKERYI